MTHWHRVLPLPILDVQYEDLVASPESKIREMLAFAGLDWDERCLSFHETNRTVRTASNWQVRKPLSTSSIGRWRRYEKQLGPLVAALADTAPAAAPAAPRPPATKAPASAPANPPAALAPAPAPARVTVIQPEAPPPAA